MLPFKSLILYTQSVFSGGIVNQQTKAEKNRENHERKKANKIAKRGNKSNEPFRCPWCLETRRRSEDILRHMFVILINLGLSLLIKCDCSRHSHAFTKFLSNTQLKNLKRAHQDELVAKLQDISTPYIGHTKTQISGLEGSSSH